MRNVSAVVLAALLATAACSTSGKAVVTKTVVRTVAAAPSAKAPATTPTGDDSGGAAAGGKDPCSLLTKAEADHVAGVTLQPAKRELETCTFATPTTGATGQLEIYVGDGAKKYYDIDNVTLGHDFRDVAGIGDEAHLESDALFFRSGTTWVGLRVLRLDSVDVGPLLEDAAKKAAGQL